MKIDIPFAVTAWEQAVYDTPAEGPALARATVKKAYNGALVGEGVAELLMCGQEGYIANERVTGTLDGRTGTFVIQHGGMRVGDRTMNQFGAVVPGSGTGDLATLRGDAIINHGMLSFDYTFD
ncbi:MAG: DUF3224 domain-containing protein [Rhodothermales bacterium]|nr:DUF3224 domain-containing protein [Rhodothermales bacterium]